MSLCLSACVPAHSVAVCCCCCTPYTRTLQLESIGNLSHFCPPRPLALLPPLRVHRCASAFSPPGGGWCLAQAGSCSDGLPAWVHQPRRRLLRSPGPSGGGGSARRPRGACLLAAVDHETSREEGGGRNCAVAAGAKLRRRIDMGTQDRPTDKI